MRDMRDPSAYGALLMELRLKYPERSAHELAGEIDSGRWGPVPHVMSHDDPLERYGDPRAEHEARIAAGTEPAVYGVGE